MRLCIYKHGLDPSVVRNLSADYAHFIDHLLLLKFSFLSICTLASGYSLFPLPWTSANTSVSLLQDSDILLLWTDIEARVQIERNKNFSDRR